jgi:hypothetical protein
MLINWKLSGGNAKDVANVRFVWLLEPFKTGSSSMGSAQAHGTICATFPAKPSSWWN